jgi:hypothetical protein
MAFLQKKAIDRYFRMNVFRIAPLLYLYLLSIATFYENSFLFLLLALQSYHDPQYMYFALKNWTS